MRRHSNRLHGRPEACQKKYRDRYCNVEAEIIDPVTHVPRIRQLYNMNKFSSAEFDSNGDGQYDLEYEYDFFEQIEKTSRKSPE